MINKLLNKTISVFLTLIFITGLFPPIVFSEPSSSFSSVSDIRGFNKSVFNSYLSRADRELDPERWLIEAKLGVSQAIGGWELISGNLYDNPLLIAEAKHQLENWSNDELEKRFSQWLVARFFINFRTDSLLNFSQLMNETQKKYSWYLDNQGNILFDEQTGDPLIIRPDEENNPFSLDLLKWREQVNNNINNSLTSLDNKLLLLYPELLDYIPNELREKTNKLIVENLISMSNSIKAEFENIMAIEERKFISRRTRDIWSLRNKSENESAKIFAEKLIAETEETCKNGINNLKIKIEQAEAGIGDLALLGEEWLQLYKEQFDRGLKAWEEAEERFFTRRIEWEQDSLNLFNYGLEVWQTALKDFEEKRNLWEKEAESLFEAGKKLFKDINEDLEKNITNAKIEFELNKAMRIGEGTTRVKALIDMYLICSSAALSSKENLQFWHDQYNAENKVNPKDEGFSAWIETNIENTENKIETMQNNSYSIFLTGSINKLKRSLTELKEMKNSYEMYNKYMLNALDAREKILENYSNLFDFGSLKDILSQDATSEDFYLDEYQLALIRAKALVGYYENKTAIAKAVSAYANELTSGRMTEAEGLKAWENAKNAYTLSLAEYEAELKTLTGIGNEIQSKQIELADLMSVLQQEEAKLNQLYSDYTALVSSSAVNMQNIFRSELKTKYKYLTEDYKKLFFAEEESLYSNAHIHGLNWGYSSQIETAQYYLDLFINGNDDDLLSLSELEKSKSEVDIKIRYALIYLFADNANGDLRAFNSSYSGADWYTKATGYIIPEQEEKSDFCGSNLYTRLYNDFSNSLLKFESDITFENLENLYFYETLLKYFNEYAFFSFFMQNEIWQNSCLLLSNLLKEYGFTTSSALLPEPNELCNSIKKKNGDFLQNISQFLIDFENCFSLLPQWLGIEINIWKESFIDFTTVYMLNNNIKENKSSDVLKNEKENIQNNILSNLEQLKKENISEEEIYTINSSLSLLYNSLYLNNYQYSITNIYNYYKSVSSTDEKHWREYLTEEYIDELDPIIKAGINNIAGIFEDAFDVSLFNTKRINNALSLYNNSSISLLEENSNFYYKLYNRESSQVTNLLYYLNIRYKDIADTAKAYDFSKLNTKEINEKIKLIKENIDIQEEKYNIEKSKYLQSANQFITIGERYDNQYSITKKVYENIKQKRIEYEKYEAIQRWASTSYLGIDIIKLDEYKTKLERAEIVLLALSDLSEDNKMNPQNKEYDALFSAYKEIFTVKLLLTETNENENSEFAREYTKYLQLFDKYSDSLKQFGNINLNYNDYFLPKDKEDWTLRNVITKNDEGLLTFSKDSNMSLTIIDKKTAFDINIYFNKPLNPNNEYKSFTAFEEALIGLSKRMAEYFKNKDKFEQWSYAGEYLISELIKNNTNINFLKDAFTGVGEINGNLASVTIYDFSKAGTFAGLFNKYTSIKSLYSSINESGMKKEYKDSWLSLSDEEKADLEFYVILSLGGSNDYMKGFSKLFSLNLYKFVYKHNKDFHDHVVRELDKWYKFMFFPMFSEIRDVERIACERIKSVLNETEIEVDAWTKGLTNHFSSIEAYALAYNESLEKIKKITGVSEKSKNIIWEDIKLCLQKNKRIKEENLETLEKYWIKMNSGSEYKNKEIISALSEFLSFINIEEIRIKNNLESFWTDERKRQENNKNDFLTEVNSYISGTGNLKSLKAAAEKAYGKNFISIKNYYNDSHDVIINNLSKYLDIDTNLYSLFGNFGNDLSLLTGEMLDSKYSAELTAREIEWDLIRKDISDKEAEWNLYADMIIETGRTDWAASRQKMVSALKQWQINFQNEYDRVSKEWNEAYLASLNDKEEWLQKAADAAYNASSESFLSLIGTEGERLSRIMDTREPLGIRIDANEANTLMAELLQSSGIINMSKAFNSINNITSSISTSVRQGLKGNTWNAAHVKVTVADFIRNTNAEIADSETRKLAYNAKMKVEEAKKSLAANVDTANINFKSNMDDLFVDGLWTKKGNNYEKEILKGATLLTSIITQKVTIKGYENYILQPIMLETNLDADYLASLDTLAIRGLLDSAYNEIELIAKEIFGTDEKSIPKPTVEKQKKGRVEAPGKFGKHIGYGPDHKPSNEMGEEKKDMFYDQGSGEVGRLLSEYIYWNVIDEKGNYELNMAPWDKRLWNDEGSWFKAPNLRTISSISTSIMSSFVTGNLGIIGVGMSIAMNSTNDLFFACLDMAGEYKKADEAFTDFGKKVLTNTVTAFIGAAFNGVQGTAFQGLTKTAVELTSSTLGKIAIKTAMAGIQTATTSIMNNAINGITYSREDGFGYNKNVFNVNFGKNLGINMLTSMTSTFVTTGLTAINSSLDFSKLKGFENLNKENLAKLNDLIGSLAGQAVNYAMGNDFTLNLLNASLFSNGKVNGGLFEMHFGHDGVTGNIGMGGANVSIDNIIDAVKGAMVWNVNNRISIFGKKNDFDSLSALRALYGYGDKVQNNLLRNILKGDTILNIDEDGNFSAETINKDGKKVVYLTGYRNGMSFEDQMLLAVILGHEAYRDGYKTGETNASGKIITEEDSLNELQKAIIAKLMMSNRINDENSWFYDKYMGLEFENSLLNFAKISGDYSLFYDYLELAYYNEKDYHWLYGSTGNDFQNNYAEIPLLNGSIPERAEFINSVRLKTAYVKYMVDHRQKQKEEPLLSQEKFSKDNKLLNDFGYRPVSTDTIAAVGCMFMVTKYGIEAIQNESINTVGFNNFIKYRNLIYNGSDNLLSNELMAQIMTSFSGGQYTVILDKEYQKSQNPISIEQLETYSNSQNEYFIHLRIKNPDNENAIVHSVMVSGINYVKDDEGQIIDVIFNVANPLISPNHYNGRSSYSLDAVLRADVFKITRPTI